MPARKPRIVILVGLPGSGKSTWAAAQGVTPVSSDALRLQLADDETAQHIHVEVFAAVRYFVAERLKLARPLTIVDATHLTPWERKPYFALAAKYQARVEAVLFATPLEECKRRNALRHRQLPGAVLDAMQKKLVPPMKSEGFAQIHIVEPTGPKT